MSNGSWLTGIDRQWEYSYSPNCWSGPPDISINNTLCFACLLSCCCPSISVKSLINIRNISVNDTVIIYGYSVNLIVCIMVTGLKIQSTLSQSKYDIPLLSLKWFCTHFIINIVTALRCVSIDRDHNQHCLCIPELILMPLKKY